MDLIQILTVAIVQGLTEFLPISSSAHLILLPHLLGWPDQGLAYDVAVHVGTLTAVVVYFRGELRRVVGDWLASLAGRPSSGDGRLVWWVVIGTVPVGLAGLLLGDWVEVFRERPTAIAWPTIGFGVLLGWAAWRAREVRDEFTLGWRDVVFVGLMQALALIPGTSRSGITMTAGLMLGLDRAGAARFSFLLAIPVIALAGLWEAKGLAAAPAPADWTGLGLAALAAGVTAYLCIEAFLRLLAVVGFMPFVVYRVVLGGLLLALFVPAG